MPKAYIYNPEGVIAIIMNKYNVTREEACRRLLEAFGRG